MHLLNEKDHTFVCEMVGDWFWFCTNLSKKHHFGVCVRGLVYWHPTSVICQMIVDICEDCSCASATNSPNKQEHVVELMKILCLDVKNIVLVLWVTGATSAEKCLKNKSWIRKITIRKITWIMLVGWSPKHSQYSTVYCLFLVKINLFNLFSS